MEGKWRGEVEGRRRRGRKEEGGRVERSGGQWSNCTV